MLKKAPLKGLVYQHLSTIFAKSFSLSSHPWSKHIEVKSFLPTISWSPWLFLQDEMPQAPVATHTATTDPQLLFIYFSNHCSKLELSATKAEHIPWSEDVILRQLSPAGPTFSWGRRSAKLKPGWRGAPDIVAPWHNRFSAEVVPLEVKEREDMPVTSAGVLGAPVGLWHPFSLCCSLRWEGILLELLLTHCVPPPSLGQSDPTPPPLILRRDKEDTWHKGNIMGTAAVINILLRLWRMVSKESE